MVIQRDEWSPLLQSLKDKVSAQGRRKLLFQMIGDIYDITVLNFGHGEGINRPAQWSILSQRYAQEKKGGDRTPTLELTGALKSGFVHDISGNTATLTNMVEYADQHQFGAAYKNLPARPYYPVDESGLNLTPYAEARQMEIVEGHFKAL